jgi:hypothetical protein
MEQRTQTLANHTKYDWKFHYVCVPLFFLNLVYRVYELVAIEPGLDTIWDAIFALALIMALYTARINTLKVQDRVIRLEERLRLQALLPDTLRCRISELTESQLIALRFASDAEVPGLVEQVMKQNLDAKQIKKLIQSWRPDHFRA